MSGTQHAKFLLNRCGSPERLTTIISDVMGISASANGTRDWVMGHMRKVGVFVRWLFSAEQLGAPAHGDRVALPSAPGFLSWLLRGGEMPSPPHLGRRDRSGPHFVAWIISQQAIPLLQPRPAGRSHGVWRWTVSTETLAHRDAALVGPAPRTGFLRWLWAADLCPVAPPPPRRNRRGFSHWLLSAEECPRTALCASRQPKRAGFVRWLLSPQELLT